MNQKKGSIMK